MNQIRFVKILFFVLSFSLCCVTSQASSCRYSPNRFTYFENDAHVVDSLGVAQSKLALRYQKEFSKFKIAVLADTEFLIQLYDKLSKRNNKYLLNSTEAKYLNTLKVGHSFQTGDIVGENQLEYIFLGVNYYLAQKKASQSAYFYRSLDKEAVLQESLNSLIISLRDSSLRKKVEENPLVFYSAFYRKAAKWINRLRFDQYSGGSQKMKLNEEKLREYVYFQNIRKKLEQKLMREPSDLEYFQEAKISYPNSKFTKDLGSFTSFIESVRHNQDGYNNYREIWQVDSDVYLSDSAYIDLLNYSKDLNADNFVQYTRNFSVDQVRAAVSRTSRLHQRIISMRFFQKMTRESVHEIISYWLNFDITLERYRALERRAFIEFQKEMESLL